MSCSHSRKPRPSSTPEVKTPGGLLTIGELARRAGVTASALRYYEELGLLPPAGQDLRAAPLPRCGGAAAAAPAADPVRTIGRAASRWRAPARCPLSWSGSQRPARWPPANSTDRLADVQNIMICTVSGLRELDPTAAHNDGYLRAGADRHWLRSVTRFHGRQLADRRLRAGGDGAERKARHTDCPVQRSATSAH